MTTKIKDEKEKTKLGLFEFLREVVGRIKEEVSLLGFVFALIVAYVAISTQQFSVWVAVTFISLYLVAGGFYLYRKTRKISSQLKEERTEGLEWKVGYPPAFQNPIKIREKRPNLGIVHFEISFEVKNRTKKNLSTSIYIKSPTQAVAFVWDEPRRVWQRRLGIIPYRKEFEFALDNLETRNISPNQQGTFNFHGWCRPRFAFQDFNYRKKIVLSYRMYAQSEDGFFGIKVDSGERKLEIPFKDKVQYAKKS